MQRLLTSPIAPASLNVAKMKPRQKYQISSLLLILCLGIVYFHERTIHNIFNTASSSKNEAANIEDFNEGEGDVPFDGIMKSEWCLAPAYEPLPFEDCKFTDFMFRFPANGGLTNALHFILKGVLWSYEENVCYFVEEKGPNPAQMAERDPPLENIDPFLERYFEPMSLPRDHRKVKDAMRYHKFLDPDYFQIQYHEYGRFSGGLLPLDDPIRHKTRDIQSLFLYEKDNIIIKKIMMRRLFRILPEMRDIACKRLNDYGLNEEYLALSVRRGDKELEYELESSLQPYIDKAEVAINTHFDGIPPVIFVASDDCSVMKEIRELRKDWKFVGECDNASEQNGFILSSAKKWTEEQTDRHYEKFITEMIAMASAKCFIGVATTNVSYWIYFMRHINAKDDTWVFVDTDQYPH